MGNRRMDKMWEFCKEEKWICALLSTLVLLFIILIDAGIQSQKEWVEYAREHDCKIVGHKEGENFNTINTNGTIGIGSIPSQTAYLCNDGVTYWR